MFGIASGLFLDLFAKEILRTYSLQQFVLVRSLIAIVLLLAIAPRFGGIRSLVSANKAWHVLRTILAVGTMFGFFYGLAHMPLVNTLILLLSGTTVTWAHHAIAHENNRRDLVNGLIIAVVLGKALFGGMFGKVGIGCVQHAAREGVVHGREAADAGALAGEPEATARPLRVGWRGSR